MKTDHRTSFKSLLSNSLNTIVPFLKKWLTPSPSKVIQECDGSIWKLSLSPFSCLEQKTFLDDTTASIFPSSSTITYALQVPKLSSQDTLLAIKAYIEEQMGQEITRDSSLVYLEQKGSLRNERRVTAVLTQKKNIDEWIENRTKETDISSRWFFPKQLCLQAFAEKYCPQDIPTYIIDLAQSEITLLCMEKGFLVACRSIPLDQNTPQESFEIRQIAASLLSWNNNSSDELPQIILTGTNLQNSELVGKIKELLPYLFYNMEPSQELLFAHASSVGAYLLDQPSLIGQIPPALLSSSKTPYKNAWKKTIIIVSLAAFLLSCFFYASEKKQEKDLKASIEQEFASLSKESWADSFKELLPSIIQSYTDAQEAIQKVQSEMKKQSLYPLQPNLPQFSEIMKWLGQELSTISPKEEAIAIQKLTYSFVQYPTIDQPKKHYQLKIDLEFTTNNAQAARTFHEWLLSPQNGLIDQLTEVKWIVSQGTYKTVFFIKDKTNYNSLI